MAKLEGERLTRARSQSKSALAKAQRVRKERSDIKDACRRGKIDPFKLVGGELEEFEDTIAEWRLEHLIRCVPGIGPATSVEIYSVGKFSPRMMVSALSAERRKDFARLCREGARRQPGQ